MSSVGEVDKTLLAFLNGLSRRQYFGEDQFSDEFLREEVLGNIEEDGKMLLELLVSPRPFCTLSIGKGRGKTIEL